MDRLALSTNEMRPNLRGPTNGGTFAREVEKRRNGFGTAVLNYFFSWKSAFYAGTKQLLGVIKQQTSVSGLKLGFLTTYTKVHIKRSEVWKW